jgi:putative peptide zinc metalloprotease protein
MEELPALDAPTNTHVSSTAERTLPPPPTDLKLESGYPLDVRDAVPRWVLPRDSGQLVVVSGNALFLLTAARDGMSVPEVATTLSERQGRAVTPSDVDAAYLRVLDQVDALPSKPTGRRSGIWFRATLFRAPFVNAATQSLGFLFRPFGLACALIFIVSGVGIGILRGFPPATVADVPLATFLLAVSALIHELGHAAAATRYGARPGAISFAMYLLWPAFCCDVTDAWKLQRRNRIVVDVAGVYWQSVVAGGCGLVYGLTQWQPAGIAMVAIVGYCLVNLVPLFRLDGYWLLSDTLGIAHLDRHGSQALARIVLRGPLARFRRQPAEPPTVTSRAAQAILAAHGACWYGAWVLFGAYLLAAASADVELPTLIARVVSGQDSRYSLVLPLGTLGLLARIAIWVGRRVLVAIRGR